MRLRLLLLVILPMTGALVGSNPRAAVSGLPRERMTLAQAGVEKNEDWLPLTRHHQGVEMALVPAGCFVMGTTETQLPEAERACDSYYGAFVCPHSFANEQPAHEVCLSRPYWIDVTPVTNLQYLLQQNSRWPSPYSDLSLPLQAISWQQAAAYCSARGGRLPSEAEWEFAARGPDALIYPYGNTFDVRRSTLRKVSVPEVGQITAGASWVGAMDMSGGMAEWVSDWYGPYQAGRQEDPSGAVSGTERILRGGDWFAHSAFLLRSAFREGVEPHFASSKNGFRCAMDAGLAPPYWARLVSR